MRSGRLLSSSASSSTMYTKSIFIFLSTLVPFCMGISTTHHDKPEDSQPIKMASKMKETDGFTASSPLIISGINVNTSNSNLESFDRQKRLLPYMTFYLEQDFNRPYNHPPPQHVLQTPQILASITPTNYATTGALNVKQPTILQQYHNKFTELTNGISYQPAPKYNAQADKVRLTPFSHSNALPGPFLPIKNPPIDEQPGEHNIRAHVQIQSQPNLQPPTKQPPPVPAGSGERSTKQQPNYSAIYDKLSQLKLQQQYQLAQSYNTRIPQYSPQQVLQLQVPHPATQNQGTHRKPVQVQHVGYIPIRDFTQVAHKQSPVKTIVQTYTPSSIDIPSPSHVEDPANNVEVANNEEGNAVADEDGQEQDDIRYEPEHVPQQHLHHRYHHHQSPQNPLPAKTYNEPIKHYGVAILPQSQPQNADEYKFPVEVKKHVLKPVILVRQKPSANNAPNNNKPYLILQRKPPQTRTQEKAYDYELQIPETINFRPIKFNYAVVPKYHQQPQLPQPLSQVSGQQKTHSNNEELGKIVVESVTSKYIDIIPKYEVKPTLLTYSPNYGKPYKYSYQETGPSASAPSAPSGPPSPIRIVLPQDLSHSAPHVPTPPSPATPHPQIISYQRPTTTPEYKALSKKPPALNHYSPQEQDYIETEDVIYQKPTFSTVQVEYANEELAEDELAPITTTRTPEPVYIHTPSNGKHSHSANNQVNYVQAPEYVTTPIPYPTKVVFTPTVATKLEPVRSNKQEEQNKPEYQEGANSLSLILKKLQDTNALPQTLTPENIDNSIRTLVKILSGLKKTPKFQRPIIVQENSGEYEGNNEAGVGLGEVPGTVTQIFPENTPEGGTPGTPGVDYPALSNIPQTSFNCKTQRYKGFFGDPDTNCQVWHYCDLNGGQASFLCPNGTIFSQVALTCDWWYNVKCSNTAQLYVLNERLYKYILPLSPKFPEDYSGPLVDRYLALKFQEMEEKMKKERKPSKENSSDEDAKITPEANPSTQDDAEELRKETHRHEASLLVTTVSPTHSAPIVVPDESNETGDSSEATTFSENENIS